MSAGSLGSSVDTMVPESTKRICQWNECVTIPAHGVGLGQGRLYLPGMPELSQSDPDITAAVTPFMFGTFSANPIQYITEQAPMSQMESTMYSNKYSAPYGKS